MSATFRLQQKKKYTQNDLRRLMNEQRAAKGETSQKVDSPLAKYNDQGQLICILCQSIVRSEAVWKVHVNSKNHKENLAAAKALKEKVLTQPKRPATPPQTQGPVKKLKGILKNSSNRDSDSDEDRKEAASNSLPSDFFDSASSTIIKKDLVNISREPKPQPAPEPEKETLPEGFFDDPRQDAKARNAEFKDPNDEEWEKFQKEIKEAANVADELINDEQIEATAERQIEEIDEQIKIWTRVLEIEKKKEAVVQKLKAKEEDPEAMEVDGGSEESEGDDADLDEFLDWRAKKSHK